MQSRFSIFGQPSYHFWNNRSGQAWICSVLILVGMVYAPFLQSLGFILLLLLVLFDWKPEAEFPLAFSSGLGSEVRALIKRPDYIVIPLYFGIVLWGGFALEDPGYWLARLRIKAPFLFFPLVFFLMPSFSRRGYVALWYILLALLALTSLGILMHYWSHFGEINAQIKMGQAMPMPSNHIRYSLLQTMGVAGGLYLLAQGTYLKYAWERYVVILLVLWLVIAQHLIAVRSGLVVLYVVLLYAALRYMWSTRRWMAGVALIGALAAGPILAYQLIPSFKTKVQYARYDMEMYRKKQDQQLLSDASRWVSWEIGWDVFRQSPLLGVGAGNLRNAVERAYAARYPAFQNRLMPHNQFLFVAAGSGVLGLGLFLTAFLVPLFYKQHYLHFPIAALHLNVLVSFMVEATLENAMGVAFFIFFLGIGIKEQAAFLVDKRTHAADPE